MKPDEVIEKLKKLGVLMSRRTLYNYEQEGLISKPDFRNSKTTDYPDTIYGEAYASFDLKNNFRIKQKEVAQIRELALKKGKENLWNSVTKKPDYYYALRWLTMKDRALREEGDLKEDEPYWLYIKPLFREEKGASKTREISIEKFHTVSDESTVPVLISEEKEPDRFNKWYNIWKRLYE